MKTYLIDDVNKTIHFSIPYGELMLRNEVKRIADWNPELKLWIAPVNSYTLPIVSSFIKRNKFERVYKKKEGDVDISYNKPEVDIAYLKGLFDAKDFAYDSRDYQLEALAFGLDKKNIINGDDVGLGKTFESIMYTEISDSFPCLVVVPASVKYNWLEKWSEIVKGRRNISVIESKETSKHKNNWDAEICIINYDILGKKKGTGTMPRFQELIDTSWRMIIFDEAHFLKNKSSARAKIASRIVKKHDEARVQLLTGTAVMNKPVELWNLLILSHNYKFISPDWQSFIYRYCGAYKGKFGWVTSGATNILELNRKMRENFYIRREKREVLDELPDLTKQVLNVSISNSREYLKAEKDVIEYIREIKGDEAADAASEAEHLVALAMLRQLSIKGKTKAIDQYLKDWSQGDKKLLVFGVHKEALEILSEKYKCPLIAGGVGSKQKQEIVNTWKTSDDMFLFANIQSAGTGVDGLQEVCSNMIIVELPWRPSDLVQAIGRLDRSGQKEATTVTFLLSEKTIDQQMWEMLEEKELVTEATNKGIDLRKSESGLKSVMKKILKKSEK